MEQTFKIAAIMTAPRYECVYARNQIERALKELGIPLTISGGVFYGQCMQKMMEALASYDDVDFVVTIDFDSVFSAKQLQRLINLIASNEEIDAITGLQARRGKPVMLGTVPGGVMNGDTKQIVWDGTPILATTAHFGLTVIDLRKLRNVEKPWFFSKPDENGEWELDKIDDDVWFWLQWKKAGNTIYIDPGVRIGHMEEMIAIHCQDGTVNHVYPSKWEEFAYEPFSDETVAAI
tara:strand:+ start:2672 stop:3376 length:705 start_codon:yes stop_codon:yes gene_type:complete